jgi:hypothetical protein
MISPRNVIVMIHQNGKINSNILMWSTKDSGESKESWVNKALFMVYKYMTLNCYRDTVKKMYRYKICTLIKVRTWRFNWRKKGVHWQPFPTPTAVGHLEEVPAASFISGGIRLDQDSADSAVPLLFLMLLETKTREHRNSPSWAGSWPAGWHRWTLWCSTCGMMCSAPDMA